MIKAIAFEYHLLLTNYQAVGYKLFLDAARETLKDEKVLAFLGDFIDESGRNNEYISNLVLFRRVLRKYFDEASALEVAKRLQCFTLDLITRTFTTDKLNPLFTSLVASSREKGLLTSLILEPYFNQEVAQTLIDVTNVSGFDYVSTNEVCHYGDGNIRFYFEILEQLGLDNDPSTMLYVSANYEVCLMARKLGMEVFWVGGEAGAVPLYGSLAQLVEYIASLPQHVGS